MQNRYLLAHTRNLRPTTTKPREIRVPLSAVFGAIETTKKVPRNAR